MQPIPLSQRVAVTFENRSACTWPGLGIRPEGLIGLTYRWVAPDGQKGPTGPFAQQIDDIAPGATVESAVLVSPPRDLPGTWRLEVDLIQHGRRTCHARGPRCLECPLLEKCPRVGLPPL